jgi:hypothetical protein
MDKGAGNLELDQYAPPINPVKSITLKIQKIVTRNEVTLYPAL